MWGGKPHWIHEAGREYAGEIKRDMNVTTPVVR